ncbi:MAG TPA: substrate-binding domain-containing protein, partial [Acidobacteriota bacterium]|nr:substrate-binding domain-containing protein [Acidobacteriota bacterium]
IAAGVIEAADQLGRKVPNDLSVVGFDALDEFLFCRPRITSVGTKKEKIGEYCALLAIRQIEGGGEQPNVRIPMKLVEGGSCAPRG